ncbi:MAG: L,D-transpeptidase [Solirubrobacteraceae bacterium]|nr:L,D-transpeptidase [Solirubrobacteraceae bacterium]
MRWTVALALGMFLLGPATAAAEAPAPAPAPAAETTSPPEHVRPDPTKVVAAGVREPLELLQAPGDEIKLSDEKRTTRWAHAQSTVVIRQSPRTGARTMGRLRFMTEDRLPEVYLVLAARKDAAGRTWLRIRIPMRPNGRTGWVRDEMLSSQLYVVRTRLVVDRRNLRATLYRAGKRVWQARVGVGKASTPTPRGKFWIRVRLKGLGGNGVYGPWAFGTSAYSNLSDWPGGGVVGIHGTNQPGLIPGRPSAGCVRVRNDQIRRLARLMPIGTPVEVVN